MKTGTRWDYKRGTSWLIFITPGVTQGRNAKWISPKKKKEKGTKISFRRWPYLGLPTNRGLSIEVAVILKFIFITFSSRWLKLTEARSMVVRVWAAARWKVEARGTTKEHTEKKNFPFKLQVVRVRKCENRYEEGPARSFCKCMWKAARVGWRWRRWRGRESIKQEKKLADFQLLFKYTNIVYECEAERRVELTSEDVLDSYAKLTSKC